MKNTRTKVPFGPILGSLLSVPVQYSCTWLSKNFRVLHVVVGVDQ